MLNISQLPMLLNSSRFRVQLASLMVCLGLSSLMSGCATKEVDPTAGMSPEKIYADA